MKLFDPNWLDVNGFIMPQPSEKPSDNGVLFSAVAIVLGYQIDNYASLVKSCFLEDGLMARWPKNNFDQAAWDDYLGVAVASIYLKNTELPRSILWYGLKHGLVYNTDRKLEGKDWLLRNIPIWGLMFAAAFPKLKLLAYPLIAATQYFFNTPNLSDTSAIQLQWMFLKGAEKLGFRFQKLDEHEKIIEDAMKIYYHKDHPFNQEAR